jgi:two-component system response regulator
MQNRSVLLVEDNPDDESLTLRAFRKHNITDIVIKRDGAEALDYLLGSGALPAVVLLDLKLPKVEGLEVLRQLRASGRTRILPVVILTSSREERDLLESYSRGANSYIRKPVDFVEFTEAVRQLSVYWLELNEPPPIGA